MPKFYLPLLLLALVFSGCYSARQNGLIEKPGSSMTEQQDLYLKDFGQVKAGDVARYSFVIKNKSSKVLNIRNVATSCGCAVSEVKNKILKPGESTFVDVKFNSYGYSGAVQQFVYVSTDSLDEPLIRFIIKANVTK